MTPKTSSKKEQNKYSHFFFHLNSMKIYQHFPIKHIVYTINKNADILVLLEIKPWL